MKKYNIIYADPAWEYKNKQINFQNYNKGKKYINSVEDHYPTIPIKELKEIKVSLLPDKDCLLFMWATCPNLDIAIELGKAWGFDYKTVAFVWDKQRTNYGFYTLSQCELCLVFKKGRIPNKSVNNIKQFFSEKLGKHSVKPSIVRDNILKMFPKQNKIELFAREKTEGWDAIGNEIDGRDIRDVLKEYEDFELFEEDKRK